MEQIEKLKKELAYLNENYPQSVKLNPTISLDAVRQIENRSEISLPTEYVEFITLLGDGGTIDSNTYGHSTLNQLGCYEEDGYSFEHLKLPFPLTHSWMPDWGDCVDGVGQLDEAATQLLKDKQWETILNNGHIVLMDDQSDNFMKWILIISGPCRGEVWRISEFGVQRLIECNFLMWLELYLSGKTEDYLSKCKEIEYPSPDRVNLEEFCRWYLKKEKYVLDAPVSIRQVQEFEEKHSITLPEEYRLLISKIGDGSKKAPFYISKVHSVWDSDCLENLSKPFLIQTEEDYKKVFLDENGHYQHFGPKHTIWFSLFGKEFDEAEKIEGPWLLPQYQLLNGCIPLLDKRGGIPNKKDTGQCILILNGQYRGQVWGINCWWIKPAPKTGLAINALSCFEAIGNNVI